MNIFSQNTTGEVHLAGLRFPEVRQIDRTFQSTQHIEAHSH